MSKDLKVLKVRNPVWSNPNHTMIDALVTFNELGEVPYTSSPNGKKQYSIQIWNELISGQHGEIGDYTPPPEPSIEEISQFVRNARNRLINNSDWTQLPDIPENTRNKWAEYRQQLRDIPQQKGFPKNITWPKKPS